VRHGLRGLRPLPLPLGLHRYLRPAARNCSRQCLSALSTVPISAQFSALKILLATLPVRRAERFGHVLQGLVAVACPTSGRCRAHQPVRSGRSQTASQSPCTSSSAGAPGGHHTAVARKWMTLRSPMDQPGQPPHRNRWPPSPIAIRSSARSPGPVQRRTPPRSSATTPAGAARRRRRPAARPGQSNPPRPRRTAGAPGRTQVRLVPYRNTQLHKWSGAITVSVGRHLLHLRKCKERPIC
jgi:hypothetical protein